MQMMFRLTQMENAAIKGDASFEKARTSMINTV